MAGVHVENGVLIMTRHPAFKGIPTPEELGMNVTPFKAAGMLRKAAKYAGTPLKGTGIKGGGRKSSVKSVGRAAGGGKK